VAPDRSAVRSGLVGLALVGAAAVPWARLTGWLVGGPAHPAWAWPLFSVVRVAGLCLGVFAIWSAVKSWLREGTLSDYAKLGAAFGLAVMVVVTLLGPCGPGTC
jgi:hypothetical protein